MSQAILRSIAFVFSLCVGLSLSVPANAEQSFRESIIEAQQLVRDSTRLSLKEELRLGQQEAAAFWALYDKYDAEILVIENRYIDLVSEFVEHYQSGGLSDEDANRMLDASLKIQADVLAVKQDYVEQFREVLSGVNVVRLYQLENKVRAEVDAAMAVAIPLAESN